MTGETSTCREALAHCCSGTVLDIGFGGDPIVPWAICIDRPANDPRRAKYSDHPAHIEGDAWHLSWFANDSVDTVFSSHCIEDAVDTVAVLWEWLRVIKPGGHLVLFAPDQPTYLKHCEANHSQPNLDHVHAEFGLQCCLDCLKLTGVGYEIVLAEFPVPYNPYSFALVVKKL